LTSEGNYRMVHFSGFVFEDLSHLAEHYTPDGNLVKSVHYWTSAITLPYLKALTPSEHTVTFTDEIMQDVDVNSDADLIGSRPWPADRPAYDLADYFRSRGKKVVMGGSWVSLNTEQALLHCDAIVKGRPSMCGRISSTTSAPAVTSASIRPPSAQHGGHASFDYTTLPLYRPDLFKKSPFYDVLPLAGPGLTRLSASCEYCTVQTYYERTFRSRPSTKWSRTWRPSSAWRQARPHPRRQSHRNVKYAKELFKR